MRLKRIKYNHQRQSQQTKRSTILAIGFHLCHRYRHRYRYTNRTCCAHNIVSDVRTVPPVRPTIGEPGSVTLDKIFFCAAFFSSLSVCVPLLHFNATCNSAQKIHNKPAHTCGIHADTFQNIFQCIYSGGNRILCFTMCDIQCIHAIENFGQSSHCQSRAECVVELVCAASAFVCSGMGGTSSFGLIVRMCRNLEKKPSQDIFHTASRQHTAKEWARRSSCRCSQPASHPNWMGVN